jgi:hypothetical protein
MPFLICPARQAPSVGSDIPRQPQHEIPVKALESRGGAIGSCQALHQVPVPFFGQQKPCQATQRPVDSGFAGPDFL